MDYEITEKELAAQLALTHRTSATMESVGDRIAVAFGAIMEHICTSGAQVTGAPFIVYPETVEDEFEMLVCMPVAPGASGSEAVPLEEVPGGTVATTMHVGPYSEIAGAYSALQQWMADHGRRPAGQVREIYLTDPQTVPAEELLTEIDWPVA